MATIDELDAYAERLTREVFNTAEETGDPQRETFTRRVLDMLEEGGYVSNTTPVYFDSRNGVLVHGYGHSDDETILDLYAAVFSYERPTLNKSELEKIFRQAFAFVKKIGKIKTDHDRTTDVFQMAGAVERVLSRPDLARIRVFFLTNRTSAARSIPEPEPFNGIPIEYHLYDLPRIYRMETAGSLGEAIEVALETPLPCLPAQANDDDHSVFLAIVPGRLLAELYDQYRTRLLQLNVRAFLQTRGKVNKGIRETANTEPSWFLAYNNGITATASAADFERDEQGRPKAITHLTGLQIVNGGQTTATLHHVFSKDKNMLDGVDVQMKLTLVSKDKLDEVVRRVSEYSNTQNRVSQVDFSSNDKFHVEFERVSRNVWTPPAPGTGLQTRWFYVRSRGAYEVELDKNTTQATKKKFRAESPAKQKFEKPDLAKYVNCWDGKPYLVARGAQKNFGFFQEHVTENPPLIDAAYVRRVVALKILFTAVDTEARLAGAGSNKSAVTAYTTSMLVHETEQRLDLDRIWRDQGISPALREAIADLVRPVMDVILTSSGHPIEWAKKAECWTAVQAIDWQVPEALKAELTGKPVHLERNDEEAEADYRQQFLEVDSDNWQAAYEWAQETSLLELNEQHVLRAVADAVEHGEQVAVTRMRQALEGYEKAVSAGFDQDVE